MDKKIDILKLENFSSEDAKVVADLAKKLGSHSSPFTDDDLKEMLGTNSIALLVARDTETKKIVAMVTVSTYRIPYVKKAYLDDFVVDETYRGQGIGTMLFTYALDYAKQHGAAYVDFTSSPKRLEGNKLYEKLGFIKRDTNVYRLIFDYGEK